MMKTKKKILIVAGGTGGHIMPAICIAKSLQSINQNFQIEFVHGFSNLEKNIYSSVDFVCHYLSVGRLTKNINKIERCKTFFLLPVILFKSLKLIINTKADMVFGTGGAISGPILLAAFLLRKKTIIFEPNVVPGLANRWSSYFVNQAIVVFHKTKSCLKTKIQIQFAFPIRTSFTQISIKQKPKKPLKILVLGGSQGSVKINQVVSELIMTHSHSNFCFVHQTGEKDFLNIKKLYSNVKNVQVFSFLYQIHSYYEWADIVIGRAGTGTIAEISACGRVGILIPLESAADQHQLKNAQELEKHKAVILIPEKELNTQKLKNVLTDLFQNPDKIKAVSSEIYKLKLGASADNIANYLSQLL